MLICPYVSNFNVGFRLRNIRYRGDFINERPECQKQLEELVSHLLDKLDTSIYSRFLHYIQSLNLRLFSFHLMIHGRVSIVAKLEMNPGCLPSPNEKVRKAKIKDLLRKMLILLPTVFLI